MDVIPNHAILKPRKRPWAQETRQEAIRVLFSEAVESPEGVQQAGPPVGGAWVNVGPPLTQQHRRIWLAAPFATELFLTAPPSTFLPGARILPRTNLYQEILNMSVPSVHGSLRQALRGGTAPRWAVSLCQPSHGRRLASSLPTVAQQSFWKSLVPKPLRPEKLAPDVAALRKRKAKDWNPATFYIIIFLLIGSMSIHLIVLKRDFATFMRQSDVKIGLLREVVERIQKGESVDVEQALGTGNPEKEVEWEDCTRWLPRPCA